MKKIAIIASGLLLMMGTAFAQSAYKVHVIKEGETLSQLASQYGTTVGDIMRLNKMGTDSKLFIGEEVRIPNAGETVAAAVKTHVIEKGETLYQLSKMFDVSVNELRDWNNITGNNIQVGQTINVSGGGQSSMPVASSTEAPVEDPPVANTTDFPPAPSGESTLPENATVSDSGADQDLPAAEKQRDQSVFGESETTVGSSSTGSNEGAFAVSYKSQAAGTELITKGVAGSFKSASGWKDGKYFILMNDVPPGTLVKVQTKGKTVYAKVLWNLGNVKENTGLSYRISDAAASTLGVSGDQYDIIVSYYKE